MAFTQIPVPNVGDPTKKQSFAQVVINNLSYLFNAVLRILSSDGFENGSFETDVDADGTPDGWTLTLSGGAFVLDSTDVAHGILCAKFTSTGSGGGYLQYADYFEVTVNRPPVFQWQMKSSVAGVTNKVEVLFYDAAKSFISTVVIYNNTATNPTAWTLTSGAAIPPAGSKYARLKITGANSSTAGTTRYDDFQILSAPATRVPSGIQLFSASGTFTVPSGVFRVRVKVWGGGGGNGGASVFTSSGGGGGGYAEDVLTVTPGAAITVTVGAGGGNFADGAASSFGASVAANGGLHGSTGIGSGGAGTAGTIQITGGTGIKLVDGGGTTTIGLGGHAFGGGKVGRGANSNASGTDGAVIVEW